MSYSYLNQQVHSERNSVQVGAVNLLIELEIRDGYAPLDISSATIKNIVLEKPDNTVIISSGSFSSNGSDGLLYYRTQAGDLDQEGTYNAQAYISMPSFTGYSTPVSFTVYENLPLTDSTC